MPIPESQLETWSNRGAQDSSRRTHEAIRNAIDSYDWKDGVTFDVYLQGSYKNHTNIRGNSDVDVVVELTSTYYHNIADNFKAYLGIVPAIYSFNDFRTDLERCLQDYFGFGEIDCTGNKSIRVAAGSNRLKCDVVACAQYKHYEGLVCKHEGITFWKRWGYQQVINYPKVHYENGNQKNSQFRCNGRYREMVRIYKNIVQKIYEEKFYRKGDYPSYFVESLLYNVPDDKYCATLQEGFIDTFNYLNESLRSMLRCMSFTCQNEINPLFGTDDTSWTINKAQGLLSDIKDYWDSYYG